MISIWKTKSMKLKLIMSLVFLFVLQLQAQVDSKAKTIVIPAKITKDKDSTPSTLKIDPKTKSLTKIEPNISGIPTKNKVEVTDFSKEHSEFSMIDNSTLINPGTIFEKKWHKKAVDEGIKIESMSDQFLGDYRSNGKFVNIICRDHEYPDGDLVRVFVNDDIIIPSLLLTSGYKSFNVPLNPGINKIEFLALNQGESGPNTAEFQVSDDDGNLISSKKWNLLTGVKATIIITKEGPTKND